MTKTKASLSILARAPSAVCERGYEFNLTLPPKKGEKNPEPTEVFITVIGTESAKVKQHNRARINERLRIEAKGEIPVTTVEEIEAGAIENAIACTVAWRGVTNTEGVNVPFNEEDARALYEEKHFRVQALEASDNLGNFTAN